MGEREYLEGHYDQPTLDALDEGPELGTFADYFLTYADFQHPILHGPYTPNELKTAVRKMIYQNAEGYDFHGPLVYLYMTEAMVLHWPAQYRVRTTGNRRHVWQEDYE